MEGHNLRNIFLAKLLCISPVSAPMNGELEPEKKPTSSFCRQQPAGVSSMGQEPDPQPRAAPPSRVALAGPPHTLATWPPWRGHLWLCCPCSGPGHQQRFWAPAAKPGAGGRDQGPGATSQSPKCRRRGFAFIKTCSKSNEGGGCLSADLNECWFSLTR